MRFWLFRVWENDGQEFIRTYLLNLKRSSPDSVRLSKSWYTYERNLFHPDKQTQSCCISSDKNQWYSDTWHSRDTQESRNCIRPGLKKGYQNKPISFKVFKWYNSIARPLALEFIGFHSILNQVTTFIICYFWRPRSQQILGKADNLLRPSSPERIAELLCTVLACKDRRLSCVNISQQLWWKGTHSDNY